MAWRLISKEEKGGKALIHPTNDNCTIWVAGFGRDYWGFVYERKSLTYAFKARGLSPEIDPSNNEQAYDPRMLGSTCLVRDRAGEPKIQGSEQELREIAKEIIDGLKYFSEQNPASGLISIRPIRRVIFSPPPGSRLSQFSEISEGK